MAVQLTLIKDLSLRELSWCIARATNPLPVPVSPSINTLDSVGATDSTYLKVFFISGEEPNKPNLSNVLELFKHIVSQGKNIFIIPWMFC